MFYLLSAAFSRYIPSVFYLIGGTEKMIRLQGIRSLITYLSEKSILYLFIFSIIILGICTIFLYKYDYKISDILILLIPGILTAALYKYAKRNFSDTFYYFILDGLMAFSALLMLIRGI